MTSVGMLGFRAVPAGLALLLCGVLLQAPVRAADPYDAGPVGGRDDYTVSTQDVDPPGRVGRLSDVSGQVWIYNPDDREWISAERNRPVTSGDRLSTDALGRAELRVGSTVVRLDSNSELEVLRLDDDSLQLQLHRGASLVRLRDSDLAAQFEMVTAEGRFRTDRAGAYRFDRSANDTQATVISGQLSYEGRHQALTIDSGQRAEFLLDANGRAQYAIVEPKRDAFALWNADRDRYERDEPISQRYVSPEMTGVEDLDRHGRWEQDPEYGAVWIPIDVALGWAPYTTGHWTWVSPWGWTWVDIAPWGFAPFHYGRWVHRGSYWAWAPGRYVARPVYAPALVGWSGGRPPVRQPGVSVAISIGRGPGVGWFPLAPRERYVPSFRASPRYERELNRSHGGYVEPPRDRAGDRGSDRGEARDRGDRTDRGDRLGRGDRGDRSPAAIPSPTVRRDAPGAATTAPPQVISTVPGVAPMLPTRPRDDERPRSPWPREQPPNLAVPGVAVPGSPSGFPAPRPAVRPPPVAQPIPIPTPAARPAPTVPDVAEPMRNPPTRGPGFDPAREHREPRQAPAMRDQPAPPAPPSIERDNGRNSQRGADGADARRERPGLPAVGDQRADPRADPRDGRDGRDRRDDRDPRDGRDRRNAN